MKLNLKKVLTALYNRLVLYNNPFYFYGIPNEDYSIEGQLVRLKKLNLVVNRFAGESILKGYPYALKIIDNLGGKFWIEKESLFLKIGDLKFQINSAEELFIIYEVFLTEVYKYNCLRETVFIDIGMNSGVTTLYYARNPLIKKIYSYELFKPTFQLGEQNLKLNMQYAHKVTAYNYGLSNREFESTINYSLSRKGRMGLNGLPHNEQFHDAKGENVIVKDINEVFERIILESGKFDILVKMDCEGEEFNLMNSLSESGLLGKLSVLMIEWHYKRPLEIESQLKAFDFHVFSQMLPSLDSGMIYASKREGLS